MLVVIAGPFYLLLSRNSPEIVEERPSSQVGYSGYSETPYGESIRNRLTRAEREYSRQLENRHNARRYMPQNDISNGIGRAIEYSGALINRMLRSLGEFSYMYVGGPMHGDTLYSSYPLPEGYLHQRFGTEHSNYVYILINNELYYNGDR